jgi:hypothetical protein
MTIFLRTTNSSHNIIWYKWSFFLFSFSFSFLHLLTCVYIACATHHHHPVLGRTYSSLFFSNYVEGKNIGDNKKDIAFLLVWDKDSTKRFLVLLPCTCILQLTLVHFYQTSSLIQEKSEKIDCYYQCVTMCLVPDSRYFFFFFTLWGKAINMLTIQVWLKIGGRSTGLMPAQNLFEKVT